MKGEGILKHLIEKSNLTRIIILSILLLLLLTLVSANVFAKINITNNSIEAMATEVEILEKESFTIAEEVKSLEFTNQKLRQQIETLDIELEYYQEQEIEPVVAEVPPVEDIKYAYLTFDDGPSDNTIAILDFLKLNDIKATFFVIEVNGREDVYKRIVDEGHTIGVHSSTHIYSEIYQTVDTYLADIENLSNVIQEHTGIVSNILRFPGGSNNTVSHKYGGKNIMSEIIVAVEEAGYIYYDWNVDSLDASVSVQDKDVIVNAVLTQCTMIETPIILMHDTRFKTTTVEALPEIVEGLRKQGYSFDKITETTPVVQFK